jgi:hypothetical protein
MAPEGAILATNTSSLSIAVHGGQAGRGPTACIGLHFFNPAPAMKLVELDRAPRNCRGSAWHWHAALTAADGQDPYPMPRPPRLSSSTAAPGPITVRLWRFWKKAVPLPKSTRPCSRRRIPDRAFQPDRPDRRRYQSGRDQGSEPRQWAATRVITSLRRLASAQVDQRQPRPQVRSRLCPPRPAAPRAPSDAGRHRPAHRGYPRSTRPPGLLCRRRHHSREGIDKAMQLGLNLAARPL